jgi:hypothetical protein
MELTLTLTHLYPYDLHILLQSPQGTTLRIMESSGADEAITNATLYFRDSAASQPPWFTGLVNLGAYKPGGIYPYTSAPTAPAPAPLAPYVSTFSALAGEPIRGQWKLWVFDARHGQGGSIAARLSIAPQRPSPGMNFLAPVGPTTSPFVTLVSEPIGPAGHYSDAVLQAVPTMWRNSVNGVFYAAGTATLVNGRIQGRVALKKGANDITFVRGDAEDAYSTASLTVNVTDFKYYLSEGATGFYHTDITLQNVGPADGRVDLISYPEAGATVTRPGTATTDGPLQASPNDYLPGAAAFSTLIWSRDAAPLAVERAMFWDARYYGGHAGEAVDGASQDWYFAEGAQGFFSTYLLLENDTAGAATVQLTFLREGDSPFVVTRTVGPHRRDTVDTSAYPELRARAFGTHVHADVPITSERSMYFSSAAHFFTGGHESPCVTSLARKWFLAEGATGAFFKCYVLVGNPNAQAANVAFRDLLDNGDVVTETRMIAANGRLTVDAAGVSAILHSAAFSTIVTADQDIVVERAMYWPASAGWQEASNAFGVAETGPRWGLADVRVGGDHKFETFILLANPNDTPAQVEVVFRKTGQPAIVKTHQIAPNTRVTVTPSEAAAAFGAGLMSAEVQVLNYQPIAVEKALYWRAEGVTWGGRQRRHREPSPAALEAAEHTTPAGRSPIERQVDRL